MAQHILLTRDVLSKGLDSVKVPGILQGLLIGRLWLPKSATVSAFDETDPNSERSRGYPTPSGMREPPNFTYSGGK